MTDQPAPAFTEQIPSVADGLSGIASATAPVIFVDEFPISGYYNGIAHITCEVVRFHGEPKTRSVITDRMVVAHLRMNLPALVALKGAIAQIEAIMARNGDKLPPPNPPINPPSKPAE